MPQETRMALPAIADTLDAVPEAAREFYEAKDGKFALKIAGGDDVTGLKTALQRERQAAKDAAKAAKQFADLGLTPEEIAELKAAKDAEAEERAKRTGEFESFKAQQAKALAAKDDELARTRGRLETVLRDREAATAIAEAKGRAKLLLPHITAQTRVVDDAVRVVGADGQVRYNPQGLPMTVAELVAEMRADEAFGPAFEGSGASGSGAPPIGGTGGTGTVRSRAGLSDAEKSAFIAQHGFAAYKALPAA
jgi:hypothetical protein